MSSKHCFGTEHGTLFHVLKVKISLDVSGYTESRGRQMTLLIDTKQD